MKKNLFIAVLITIVAFASCIKDRSVPAPVVVKPAAGDTLIYYWDFNSQDTLVDFPAKSRAAYLTYTAAYADYTGGSKLNLIGITDSGYCLRVRNPSTDITFTMPTLGYDSIQFSFVEEASSTTSGSTNNAVTYTTDGTNYTAGVLSGNNQYTVGTTFGQHTFDFSSDPKVKNNANFAIKITFVNNNAGTSGNDRFDNVALSGVRQ